MQHKEQLGYVTVACNSKETNYLNLAYIQALSIKKTQKNNKFAVLVNKETNATVETKHRNTFDYIIEIPDHQYGPYGAEAFLFEQTPFKETIKLESDLLLTRSIDHWIHAFRLKDIVLSTGCKNYKQEKSDIRNYRKLFDDNNLPDIYSGLMYFRFTKTAKNFFDYSKQIFENWSEMVKMLKNCDDKIPSTDVVFSIAAKLLGVEQCTLPSFDFINFVHMKPAINNYANELKFKDVFVTEFDQGMIRINNINQYDPLHYFDKTFLTEEMIKYYEQ